MRVKRGAHVRTHAGLSACESEGTEVSPCKKIHVRQVELSAVLAHMGPWWPVSQSDTTGLPG